jgi:hypothetical protein
MRRKNVISRFATLALATLACLLLAVLAPMLWSQRASDVSRAYDLGANSYLVKPVGREELLTALTGSTSPAYLIVSYLVFGIGMGMVNAPITNVAQPQIPRAR